MRGAPRQDSSALFPLCWSASVTALQAQYVFIVFHFFYVGSCNQQHVRARNGSFGCDWKPRVFEARTLWPGVALLRPNHNASYSVASIKKTMLYEGFVQQFDERCIKSLGCLQKLARLVQIAIDHTRSDQLELIKSYIV